MEIVDFDTQYGELQGLMGWKRSVLAAACNVCFLKTINWMEVQKYLFGVYGLKERNNVPHWPHAANIHQ